MIPITPENTTVSQIFEWLPTLITKWQDQNYSLFYRNLFTRLIGELAKNFPDIDLSEYHEFMSHQISLTLAGAACNHTIKPFKNSFLSKFSAQYIVFSYKPIGLPNRQNYQKGGSFDLEHLVSLFLYELHPEYSTVNSEFIKFIKLISSNLCVRVSWERQQLKNDPNYSMKQFSIQKEDIAYFIDILKS